MTLSPISWSVTPLGELVEVLDSARIPVSATQRAKRLGSVPYYGAAGQVGWIDEPLFDEPLVLLGEDGVQFFDSMKSKAYPISGPAWVNNHAHVLRVRPATDRRYLLHFLNQFDYRGFANGTTRLKLTQGAMRRMPICYPDLDEQRRIVDILEDHLSRLDAAEHGLCLSLRRLASYEASALSKCRDGEERSLNDLAEIQGGIQKQPKRAPKQNAYPFLRVANVTKNGLQLDDVHQVELFDGELGRLRLRFGDLLVVEGNGSASQIGRAALWDGSIEDCVHQNHLIRVRPLPELSAPYLEAVWNSPQNRRQLTDLASSSSGLHTLSVSKLKSLRLPIPAPERQRELVAELQAVRDRRGRLAVELDSGVSKAKSLRRALLAAAFSGRLTGRTTDMEMVEEMAGV
jgi:type I restriction enzyme S subunit